MRLQKIKLAGFKSFVDPTTIIFPARLMSIVGPNGCGKSNVIDAVKWVMGESSAKTLRGDTMADVIFSGSNTRKPVGMAAVELIFDNREGRLGGQYARFTEISVKRTVSRDGPSQYTLNGSKCRRRDITDVFLGTGLGAHSYAIIEQGMISKLIEAKPEELRAYLEEAAGISKYKERRRETSVRIKHTRENLERLTDLRGELEKQLNHLKRQSESAENYKTFKQQERRAEAELLALRWKALDGKAGEREQAIKEKENAFEKAVAGQRKLEAGIEKSRVEHSEANDAMQEIQARYYQQGAEITRLESAIKHTRDMRQRQQQELRQLQQQLQEVLAHVEQDKESLADMEKQLAEGEPRLSMARQKQAASKERLSVADKAMSDWQQSWATMNLEISRAIQVVQIETTRIDHIRRHINQQTERLQHIEEEQEAMTGHNRGSELQRLKKLQRSLDKKETRLQGALEAGLDALSRQRAANAGLTASQDDSREALQQARAELATLQSVQSAAYGGASEEAMSWLQKAGLEGESRLAQNLQVAPGWERAVEVVLGHFLEAVCVADERDYTEKLNELVTGRVSLVSSATDTGHAVNDERLLLSKIKSSSNLSGLLNQVYVADDLGDALAMQLPAGAIIVTADGVCLGHGWARATIEADSEGILQREQRIQSFIVSIAEMENQYAGLTEQLLAGRTKYRQFEMSRDENQSEINALHRQLSEVRAEINSHEAALPQIAERVHRLYAEIEKIRAELHTDKTELQEARQALTDSKVRRQSLEKEKLRLGDSRDEVTRVLQHAREEAGQSDEQVSSVVIRIESLHSQFKAMQGHQERMLDQQRHLQERRLRLEQPSNKNDEPLEATESRHAVLLEERQTIERELTLIRQRVESIDHVLRELEQRRHTAERAVQDERARVEWEKMAWQEIKVRCQGLVEQLQKSEHGLEAILKDLHPEANEAECEQELSSIERRIARLGPINLAAIEEYRISFERKEYLDKQDGDLTQALKTLESAMRKIDRETRAKFKDTFDLVNAGMKKMFPRLFGGGHGYIKLTDEDLLEAGVAVMARPPGKRNSSIHLLSGGEKAMTAVSLLFSLFDLNPAPFCMLDEIDSPLDDVNIGRFCELVKEMSGDIQFIVVTHSKVTMEMTTHLMGVTMQEPGVSRLVTVDVDEAVKIAS